jgi:hypothetical protein
MTVARFILCWLFFLNCLTLEDECTVNLQHTGNHSPCTMSHCTRTESSTEINTESHCHVVAWQFLHRMANCKYTFWQQLSEWTEVLTSVLLRIWVFWDVTLCQMSVSRHVRGSCWLHLQGVEHCKKIRRDCDPSKCCKPFTQLHSGS